MRSASLRTAIIPLVATISNNGCRSTQGRIIVAGIPPRASHRFVGEPLHFLGIFALNANEPGSGYPLR
jgi:hypothetical protein